MKKWFSLLSMLVVVTVLVTACGGGATPTQAPAAQAPAATTAPAAAEATQAPAATTAPAAAEATEAPAATTAPEQPAAAGAEGEIMLWHGWTGAEAEKLAEVITAFQAANPGLTVNPLAVPFDQLKNKFTTEASTGGGPDLLIGAKDWIGELSQAGLIQPLDDMADQVGLNNLNQAALDANKFEGQVWAFPESTEAVVLWYNKDLVKTPPTSSEDLLELAAEVGLGLNTQFYHSVGLLLGGGGRILDENQACALGEGTSVTDGLELIKELRDIPKVVAAADTSKLDAAFKDGQVGLVFNGPWATGDYTAALGADKVAVADPITIPNGKFAPFLGTKNLFLSANTQNLEGAQAFLNFMSLPETQLMMTEVGHIPSNPNVKTDDPITDQILKQTASASYFPNEPEMGAVWTPAGDMITKVIEGKAEPAAAVAEACDLIDAANGK